MSGFTNAALLLQNLPDVAGHYCHLIHLMKVPANVVGLLIVSTSLSSLLFLSALAAAIGCKHFLVLLLAKCIVVVYISFGVNRRDYQYCVLCILLVVENITTGCVIESNLIESNKIK